jgi:hypothetical protein
MYLRGSSMEKGWETLMYTDDGAILVGVCKDVERA